MNRKTKPGLPDGRLKWEHYYNDLTYSFKGFGSYFNDAKEADNNDIIVTGSIDDANNENGNDRQYTWLVRLDSMGCFMPGCRTDTLSEVFTIKTEEILINLSKNIVIYPNPSSDVINIVMPEGMENKVVQIFDIMGRKLMDKNMDSDDLDVSSFSPGLYIIWAKDRQGRIATGKFVKE